MYKRKPLLLMMVAIIIFGLGAFFIGCSSSAGSDPFSKMAISANAEELNLYIDVVESNGVGVINQSGSTLTKNIVFTVKGAPSAASRAVNVRSLDPAIAKIGEVRVNGRQTTVEVKAENSGKTRIEALATGGKRIYVDVVVDIPAKDLSVKRDVYYGVLKGGTVKLAEGDFNFYSTTARVASVYSNPTLNELSYEIVGAKNAGAEVDSTAFKGLEGLSPVFSAPSVLFVPAGYPYEVVMIRPVLSRVGIQTGIIDVHVFNPIPEDVSDNVVSSIAITNKADGELLGISSRKVVNPNPNKDKKPLMDVPFLDMVLNAPHDMALVKNSVKNVATLGVSLAGAGSGYRTKPLGPVDGPEVAPAERSRTRWGFEITNHDINALNATAHVSSGTIELVAQGPGNVTLEIKFFPIARDGTYFDFSYHRALQRVQIVSIEIRNVFREDMLAFTKNDKIADQLDVFNAAKGNPPVLENFRLGILEENDKTKLATTAINNTYNKSNNNNIFFYVKEVHRNESGIETGETDVMVRNGATGEWTPKGVLDLFNIYFYQFEFSTVGVKVRPTHIDPANPAFVGLPYNTRFAITVEDAIILQGREVRLYAASIHDAGAKRHALGATDAYPEIYARIDLNCVQAIGKIDIHDQVRTVSESIKHGEKGWMPDGATKTLYPVDGTDCSPVDFWVWTDENHIIGDMRIEFNGEGALDGEVAETRYVQTAIQLKLGYFSLGYLNKTTLNFVEKFRIYQRQGKLDGRDSQWELEIRTVADRPTNFGLNYSFNLIHASRISTKVNIMPLPQWDRNPTVDLTEVSGDAIYQKYLPNAILPNGRQFPDTLIAFVRVGGTYALEVRTSPAISFSSFDLVDSNSLEVIDNPTGLSVVPQEANRKWLRADAEGVYDLTIKINVQNDEVIGTSIANRKISIFKIRIVIVDPVVSAVIEPNGVQLLSKRSLGYDLELGLDQQESKLDFRVAIGYASGRTDKEPASKPNYNDSGKIFRRHTIIDFAFENMVVKNTASYEFSDTSNTDNSMLPHRTSVIRGASDVIEITRKSIDSNEFVLQGLRPSGGNIDAMFKIRQVYELDGIVVPIDFAFTGGTGGMGVSLKTSVVDAVMIKSIIPYNVGEVIDITLNGSGSGSQVATSVNTTISPAAPYDNRGIGYLGYGLLNTATGELVKTEEDSSGRRWAVLRNNYPGEPSAEVVRVNVLSGEIIAKKQNITTGQKISLVIYALDSVQEGTFPATYIMIPIYIYDRSEGLNQRVITNVEEFLEAFYIKNNKAYSYFENAKLDRSRGLFLIPRTDLGIDLGDGKGIRSCYYQLAADIDLSYQENGFTRYLQLPPIPQFGRDISTVFSEEIGTGVSAVFTGLRSYSLAGGVKNVNYAIKNLRMLTGSDYYTRSNQDGTANTSGQYMNFGFFGMVGEHGIVDGVDFTNVSGYITGVINMTETRFGVVAGVNKGIIRDVSVKLSDTEDFIITGVQQSASNPGPFNIGLIIGRNDVTGTIEESALGQVYASGLLAYTMNARLAPVNFGGIVGLNNGNVVKVLTDDAAALRGAIMTNSDAALAVLGGSERLVNYGSELLPVPGAHGPNYYVNVGGVVGRNNGVVDGYSSEAVMHNSSYGNTGGVVGYNSEGQVKNCFSNSAMYARAAMGGVVGRNFKGDVENCYYDLYLNEKVGTTLWRLLSPENISAANFGASTFYAGMIVGSDGTNADGISSGFTGTGNSMTYNSSPTVVGGVVGVNDSGNVKYSFASSAFSNSFTSVDMLNSMPYRGDVFIYNASNVIVGGIIGRQENTQSIPSEILGCYSTLTVFFDQGAHNPPARQTLTEGAPKIGGMIGFLNSAQANVSYCYSNLSINNIARQGLTATSGFVYNGYWAHTTSTALSVTFNRCYSVIETGTETGATTTRKTVVGNAVTVDPVHSGITGATFTGVAFTGCAYVRATSRGGITNITPYTSATTMRTGFNLGTNFKYYDTADNLFPFPLIYPSGSGEPLVMASPSTITPTLKTAPKYAEIYGNNRNNQGGFNYVLPSTNNQYDAFGKPVGTHKAALFYTVGLTTPSAIVANRYFFADLFDSTIDPEIASKRLSYSVEGSTNLVEAGIEIDDLGRPRYYVDVKELGTFDIVLTSTRFIECRGNVRCPGCDGNCGGPGLRGSLFLATGRVSFDVVLGVSEMTATTGIAGLIGQKSLLNGDRMNTAVTTQAGASGQYAGQFSIQKNTPFVISGQTGLDLSWDIKMFAGMVYHVHDNDCTDPCELDGEHAGITRVSADYGGWDNLDLRTETADVNVPGKPSSRMITMLRSNNEYDNNTSFVLNQLGRMEFAMVPQMTVGNEKYVCYMLAFKIGVNVFGGAIELAFDQTVNTSESIKGEDVLGGTVIDPSTSVYTRGIFTTDITLDKWNKCLRCELGMECKRAVACSQSAVTVAEERLSDLLKFRYITGQRVEPLFADYAAQIAEGKPVSTTINKIGGQHVSLYFELRVKEIKHVEKFATLDVKDSDYFRFRFEIIVGVIVDSDGELYNRMLQNDIISPLIAVGETIYGMIGAEEVMMSTEHVNARERRAFTSVDVISQDLQHVEVQHFAGTAPRGSNLELDESQHASNSIFTERDKGGLLKVYAVPYFSNIESFNMRHNKCLATCTNGPNCNGNCDGYKNEDKPWMQFVGRAVTPGKQGLGDPIYEEWSIRFAQMVYDIDNRIYVPLNPDLVDETRFHQVSTTWRGAAGVQTYGWTGVYYLQTRLVEPEWQYTGEGTGNRVRINGASTRIDTGRQFSLVADFVTNGGRKVATPINIYTAEVPGLYFKYENVTTKKVEQAIGTEVPFRISAIPSEKISITSREVRVGSFPVETANSATAPSSPVGPYAGLVETRYDPGTDQYYVKISPNLFKAGFQNEIISVGFYYNREEDGGSTPGESWLDITPVLFKVRGFSIDGISGNTVRLTSPNRQNMSLGIISSQSTDPSLLADIADMREQLRRNINQGPNRDWLLWMAGGVRLNTALDQNGYYTNSAQVGVDGPDKLNFYLGESFGSNSSKFVIDAVGKSFTSALSVEMFFDYGSGIPFITQNIGAGRRVVSSFNITTINQSSVNNPYAIYQSNIEDLRSMLPGNHYIIMEDLILDNWIPVPFVAASLDGNGKKITINSFRFIGADGTPLMNRDIGLFSTVGMTSSGTPISGSTPGSYVLKNINIALPNVSDSLDVVLSNANYYSQGMSGNTTIRVGLLAGRNAGVITNCAVVNRQQFVRENLGENFGQISIVDYNKTTYNKIERLGAQQLKVLIGNRFLTVFVGGLVGENKGVISNSRVMIDVVVAPQYDQDTTSELDVSDLTLAGFVAENYGTIVSSYYRDGNITNGARTSTENNWTAGFIGINYSGAIVKGCYTMGVSSVLDNSPRLRGTVMYGEMSSTYGAVAGFTRLNSGTIEDCFVNVVITRSGGVAAASGFVTTNESSGRIRNCFVNNARKEGTGTPTNYHAFNRTNSGVIENCKYVSGSSNYPRNFDTTGSMTPATSINEDYLYNKDLFTGFSLATYSEDEEIITVWQMKDYFNVLGEYMITMPELVAANQIAKSVRIQEPRANEQLYNSYSYVSNPSLGIGHLGSKDNPVLISDGKQFNDYIYMHSGAQMRDSEAVIDYELNVYGSHMRLVNNIDLRRKTDFGDLDDGSRGMMTYGTTFKGATFDGNGLSINGIAFNANDAADRGLSSVGLFSKLEYATVKNVTLGFTRLANASVSIAASNAVYVGGLAGVSINSNISDVVLNGDANSVIEGRSIVGGAVGMAVVFDSGTEKSASFMRSIRTNVPVRAALRGSTEYINLNFESADEYIQHSYRDISVAGGLFGIVTSKPQAHDWDPYKTEAKDRDLLRKDSDGKIPATMTAAQRPVHIQDIGSYNNASIAVTGEVIGGLIGAVDSGIVVEQANLTGSTLTSKFFAGGLAGANLGTIRSGDVSRSITFASMAGTNYIFHSNPATVICVLHVPDSQGRCTSSCTTININYNHHGMTVGGAVGFNMGTIDNVTVAVALGASGGGSTGGNNNIWRIGGIAGENKGIGSAGSGTITNSKFGGNNIGINGGFYIGGLVGVNNGTGTVITNNTILANTTWGLNFSGTILDTGSTASIFRTSAAALNETYYHPTADKPLGTKSKRYVFIDPRVYDSNNNLIASSLYFNRDQYTGAFVGVNLDTAAATINTINNTNQNNAATLTRKVGLYTAPA